jgi:outer membrane protein TolC
VVLLILAGAIASFGPVGGRLVAADPPRSPEAAACPTPEGNAVGITLLDALRVASLANLDIAQAREVVELARAGRLRANSQILPNLNLGSTYVTHQGQIQRTEGNVINVNRQSLFDGGGPQLVMGLSDALFLPGVASNVLLATQAGARRVTNDTLLTVADAYFAVLRARRRVARIDETLDNLLSEQPSEVRDNSKGLLRLLQDFAKAGAASDAEVARAQVEIARRRDEEAAALQELRQATAELARLLRQDPTVLLWPLEDFRVPVDLPGEAWFGRDVEELVTVALENRPEVVEDRALVRSTLARWRAAKWRPALPNVVVNLSYGDFGGGPPVIGRDRFNAIILGASGSISNYAPRTDFDVSLVWRLQNFGVGNLAEMKETRTLHEQARIRQLANQDRIITQVVQAREAVQQTLERVRATRSGLFNDKGQPDGPAYRSLRLNFVNVKRAPGRPLEALDSVRGLSDLLEAYGQAVTDYERARFRLLVALGMPADALLDPRLMPLPPVCASPPPAPRTITNEQR